MLVTGAAGGVGSVAVALLAGSDIGSSPRPGGRNARLSRELGAAELIDRAAIAATPARPLDPERWAGAIDAVGGDTLAAILTR